MSYVIGVDGGTESLRAAIFDLAGHPVASAAVAYATRFPEPAQAEQDPEDWWRALGGAVREARAKAGVAPADIAAIAVDTTCCSVIALDAADAPVHPALIWMDVRAAEEAARVGATGDPALRVNGDGASPVSAEWMLPKALWLKTHRPEAWARAVRVGEYQDYLNLRLTGRWAGALNNAVIRWHYQTDHGGVPTSLLAALDLAELAERWPQPFIPPGGIVGGLTGAAAEHLDLRPDTPVVQGGADALIGVIGLGVTEPGEMALITGSSHLQLGVARGPRHAAGFWGTYKDALYPGKSIIEGGQTSTGSIIAWFKRHFAAETDYETLNALAADRPIGADGLMVLDHFQGNRTPYTDAASRGAITGLTLAHDEGHVFRAIMEGIAMGTRVIVDAFGDAFSAERIVVAGGATNSPLWLQIHADALGAPIERTEVADAPLLGCAILAAHGAGHYASIEEAVGAMVRTAETVTPNPKAVAAYEELLPRYRALYHALADMRRAGG
ncbi:MAG: FGGY-family carbohydrate kinase [Pseudomonadota bacterium]